MDSRCGLGAVPSRRGGGWRTRSSTFCRVGHSLGAAPSPGTPIRGSRPPLPAMLTLGSRGACSSLGLLLSPTGVPVGTQLCVSVATVGFLPKLQEQVGGQTSGERREWWVTGRLVGSQMDGRVGAWTVGR